MSDLKFKPHHTEEQQAILTEAAFNEEVERAKAEHPDWTEDEAVEWVRENETVLAEERLWEEADYRYEEYRARLEEERWEGWQHNG